MRGLALEGGGSRGAYHIGVYQACLEQGLTFDAICGTSIGAVNAALLAQGDYDLLQHLWKTLGNSDLFEVDNAHYAKLFRGGLEAADLSYYKEALNRVRESGGVDTRKMKAMIDSLVDVDRLLASPVDFGLVAVCLSDWKPVEFFKDQIPPEQMTAYIMASATFPGFQPTKIGEKSYIDGGLYDNCPMNMLAGRGCTEIIAVRTYAPGLFRLPRQKGVKVTLICPTESMGPIMNFDPQESVRNIQMGYYDALRTLRRLAGTLYCIDRPQGDSAFPLFAGLRADQVRPALKLAGIPAANLPPRRALFEKLLPFVAQELDAPRNADYTGILIAMLEERAARAGIDRFALYPLAEWFQRTVRAQAPQHPKARSLLPSAQARASLASDHLLQCLLENGAYSQP